MEGKRKVGRPRKVSFDEQMKADPQELFIPHYTAKEIKVIGEVYELLNQSKVSFYEQDRILKCLALILKRNADLEW